MSEQTATVDGLMRLIINDATYGDIRDYAERLAASAAVQAVPVDRAHLADLNYVLMVLEKVRDLVLPTFRKEDAAHGEIAAAINGMQYVIDRTKRGCTSAPAAPADPVQRPGDHVPGGQA